MEESSVKCERVLGGMIICKDDYIRVIVRGFRSILQYEGEVIGVDTSFLLLKTTKGTKVGIRLNEIKIIEWVEKP